MYLITYPIAKYKHTHIPPIVRKKALNVLIQQPEVDPKRISITGHGEGTIYAPRLAIAKKID